MQPLAAPRLTGRARGFFLSRCARYSLLGLRAPAPHPKAVLLASLTASPPPPAAVRSALHRGLCVGRRVIARLRRASCVRSLLSRGSLRRAPRSRPPSAACRHSLRSGALRYRSACAAARAAPYLPRPPRCAAAVLCPPPCRRRLSPPKALGRSRPRAPACIFSVYSRSND